MRHSKIADGLRFRWKSSFSGHHCSDGICPELPLAEPKSRGAALSGRNRVVLSFGEHRRRPAGWPSRSFCTACGSTKLSSTGRRRRLPRNGYNEIKGFPQHGGKRRPCRDDGDGEIARCFASARKGDRDCNIGPPASSYAIMRRACPYRGENGGPGKDDRGELDTETRN